MDSEPNSPADGPTDHALMRRVAAGDDAAFAALVRRWGPRVARVTARLDGRPADRGGRTPDDLAQEVFLRVLGAAPRYDGRAAFAVWVHTLALNVVRDAARRRSARRRHEPHAAPPASAVDPAAACERAERRAAVRDALAALPDPQREAVAVKHFSDLTFAEAAAVLGVPAGTVKDRVRAGLLALRADLIRRGVRETDL